MSENKAVGSQPSAISREAAPPPVSRMRKVPHVLIEEAFPKLEACIKPLRGGINAAPHGDGILLTISTQYDAVSALVAPGEAERLGQRLLMLAAGAQGLSAAVAANAVTASRAVNTKAMAVITRPPEGADGRPCDTELPA